MILYWMKQKYSILHVEYLKAEFKRKSAGRGELNTKSYYFL